MNITNTRIIFFNRFTEISFYDCSADDPIVYGFKLNDGNQKYLAISVNSSNVVSVAPTSLPSSPITTTVFENGTLYGPPSAGWNCDYTLIVGTGDLRPEVLTKSIKTFDLKAGNGVVVSCQGNNTLTVYTV